MYTSTHRVITGWWSTWFCMYNKITWINCYRRKIEHKIIFVTLFVIILFLLNLKIFIHIVFLYGY